MAVSSSYSDPQSTRRVDDAEASRISNRIDEELRVCLQPNLLIPSASRCVEAVRAHVKLVGREGAPAQEEEPEEGCQRRVKQIHNVLNSSAVSEPLRRHDLVMDPPDDRCLLRRREPLSRRGSVRRIRQGFSIAADWHVEVTTIILMRWTFDRQRKSFRVVHEQDSRLVVRYQYMDELWWTMLRSSRATYLPYFPRLLESPLLTMRS